MLFQMCRYDGEPHQLLTLSNAPVQSHHAAIDHTAGNFGRWYGVDSETTLNTWSLDDASPVTVDMPLELSGLSSLPLHIVASMPVDALCDLTAPSVATEVFGTIGRGEANSELVRVDVQSGDILDSIGLVLVNGEEAVTVNGMAFCGDDSLYAMVSVTSSKHAGSLLRLCPMSGQATVIGTCTDGTDDFSHCIDLACDESNQLYTIASVFDPMSESSNQHFASVDRETGAATVMGLVNDEGQVGLAIDRFDVLINVDYTETVYTVDRFTGVTSVLGARSPSTLPCIMRPSIDLRVAIGCTALITWRRARRRLRRST